MTTSVTNDYGNSSLRHVRVAQMRGDLLPAPILRPLPSKVAWVAGHFGMVGSEAAPGRIAEDCEPQSGDYVVATGETTIIRDFVSESFRQIGVTLRWEGEGVEEKGVCAATGRICVEVHPRYFRPTEVDLLIGDPARAKRKLGWVHETKWQALCAEIVAADLKTVEWERRRNAD